MFDAVQVGVLGPVVIVDDDGVEVALGSPSQRTVLAVLVAADGRAVSTDRLVEALWAEAPPRTAEQSLRTYVSRLRRVLGPRLAGRAGAYALSLAPDEVDARRFDALVDAAGGLGPTDAVATLGQALALWRGEPFADLVDPRVVEGEARRLDERRRAAQEARAAALLAAGDATAAVAAVEGLLAEEPLREGAWVVLVDALRAADRSAEAVRAVQRAGAALADAGLAPSASLRSAEQRALAGGPAADPQARPAVGGAGAVPVPSPEALVGRDADVAGVEALLDRARVVTLHGPGGVGKTSLARAVLAARAPAHRLGVRSVALASVADPAAVPLAVAEALGLSVTDASARDALARAGALDVLVCLDNAEHVLDAVAEVVELLVAGGPGCRVLVTSRERVGVAGEHSWSVAPLPTGPDGAATDLFLARARAHAPAVDVDRAAAARIVGILDGLPLAIEMAAARVGGLGPADLEQILGERFDILAAARRRGDPRHRTLAAVVEWSEDLLDDEERTTLADLAVFAGWVEAPEVEAVLDRPRAIDVVCRLVDRSLVVARHQEGRASYGLLEVVRRHARQRLDSSGRGPRLARRHLDAHVALVARADAALRSDGEAEASARLDRSLPEVRAAHGWARRHDPAGAVALSAGLHVYACSRQREEAQRWALACAPLLDAESVAPADAAVVLATIGYHANDRGRLADAEAAGWAAMERAGSDPATRFALEVLSDAALYRGDLDTCGALAQRMREVASQAGDTLSIAVAVGTVAISLAYAGRVDDALAALAEVDLAGMGPSSQGWVHYSEGEALLDRDAERAVAAFGRAVDLADLVGDRFLGAVARVSATSLLGRVGEPSRALRSFAEVVAHWDARGDVTHQLTTLRNLVPLLVRVGAHPAANALLGAVRAAPGAPSFGEEAERLEAAAEDLRRALGDGPFAAGLALGAAQDVPAAAREALAAIDDLTAAG